MNLLSLNRRRLLIGLAAASTAATVTAVPALAAINAAPVESAELIRLGDMLPALEAEFVAAHAALVDACDIGWANWPLAPDALNKGYRDSAAWERDIAGGALIRDGETEARSLLSVAEIANDIAIVRAALHRKRKNPSAPISVALHRAKHSVDEWEAYLADTEALRAVASAYEADKALVCVASGYAAARDRADQARHALGELVGAIMAEPEVIACCRPVLMSPAASNSQTVAS